MDNCHRWGLSFCTRVCRIKVGKELTQKCHLVTLLNCSNWKFNFTMTTKNSHGRTCSFWLLEFLESSKQDALSPLRLRIKSKALHIWYDKIWIKSFKGDSYPQPQLWSSQGLNFHICFEWLQLCSISDTAALPPQRLILPCKTPGSDTSLSVAAHADV